MSETWSWETERLKDRHLARRVGQVIIPSHNVGDVHQGIIDHDRKVVRRIPVGTKDDQIIQDIVIKYDRALDKIIDNCLALLGRFEPKRSVAYGVCYPETTAATIVTRRSPFGFCLLSPRLQFLGFADAPIGLAPLQ